MAGTRPRGEQQQKPSVRASSHLVALARLELGEKADPARDPGAPLGLDLHLALDLCSTLS